MKDFSAADRAAFDRDGYLVVPGVFSRGEISGFRRRLEERRRAADDSAGPRQSVEGSLFNDPVLRHVVLDERILVLVRGVLGEGLAFFGDTSALVGRGDRRFHRDNTNRVNFLGPDWEGEYPLLRVGIYLGDYTRQSGGLKVVPRSHRARWHWLRRGLSRVLGKWIRIFTPPLTWGRKLISVFEGGVPVPAEEGDVILWNFRLLHSGNALRLRWWPKLSLPPWLEDRIPAAWSLPGGAERAVLFLAFARAGDHLNRYLATRRALDLAAWQASRWDREMEEEIRRKGLVPLKPDPSYGSGFAAGQAEAEGVKQPAGGGK